MNPDLESLRAELDGVDTALVDLIARRLEISEKTVKAHLTRVFAVLGVRDRTSAALWAQRHGVVA